METLLFFLKEGLNHVLDWNAYDHILFLVALTVVYSFNDWKKVFYLISLFTVGHTLTLILSAYKVISADAGLIEFLIPLTILITASVNIFTVGKSSKKNKTSINLFFALFFGMIHGFGFSRYFKMLIGKSDDKLLPLLEFALGIEAAQIIIVIIILLVGFVFQNIIRFSRRDWVLVSSSIVIGFVIPMLLNNKIW